MPTSAVGSKRWAVSSITSRAQAATRDSPGSRWPAGWFSTSRPSLRSSTKRKRPSRSITAATVTEGFQIVMKFGSCRLLGVLADEIGHPGDALLDRLLGSGIREAHVLAFARHPGAEVDVGEQRHARLVQQALPELLGIGRADHAAGLGDVRPDVERAARGEALHAGDLVQQVHDEIASLQEARLHRL